MITIVFIIYSKKSKTKKMAAIQKFKYEDFKILDTGDLFINLWSYSENLQNVCKKKCEFCNIYRQYCAEILKERWDNKWGNYHNVMKKIYNNDIDNFINLAEYSSAEKHFIIEDLKCIEKANF